MATRRAIRGVLSNYLHTLCSRYTEYGGYWLFGFVVEEINTLSIDLLANYPPDDLSPMAQLYYAATSKFKVQLEKAGVNINVLNEAELSLSKASEKSCEHSGITRTGYRLLLMIRIKTDLGHAYEKSEYIFVAPHNPDSESRSASQ